MSTIEEWKKEIDNRMEDPNDIGKYVTIAKDYTGNGNVLLNRFLREQDKLSVAEQDEHAKNFPLSQDKIWMLYNALIDLRVAPPTTTTLCCDIVLYRGLPFNFVQHLKVGDIYHDAGFMSFSFSLQVATGFARGSGAIFVLKNPQEGVWFSLRNEYEFVVGPRCLFRVDNINERQYEITFIGYNNY